MGIVDKIIPPEFWQLLFQATRFSVVTAAILLALIVLYFWHARTYPTKGIIINKTKREELFVLVLEDKNHHQHHINTDETNWTNAKLGDPYTAQDTDWELTSPE